MTAIQTYRRNKKIIGGSKGPGGGTGSSNSPAEILKRLMEKEPKLKKLLTAYKKKMKTKDKPMKAAKGGVAKKKPMRGGGMMPKKPMMRGGGMGKKKMMRGGMSKKKK